MGRIPLPNLCWAPSLNCRGYHSGSHGLEQREEWGHYWLVVSTPLKNMKVNWDDYSQYMGKLKMFQTTNHWWVFYRSKIRRVPSSRKNRTAVLASPGEAPGAAPAAPRPRPRPALVAWWSQEAPGRQLLGKCKEKEVDIAMSCYVAIPDWWFQPLRKKWVNWVNPNMEK